MLLKWYELVGKDLMVYLVLMVRHTAEKQAYVRHMAIGLYVYVF